MKRAVREAKLKCRYCQAVFTGSTRLSTDTSPSVPTPPVGVPQPDDTPHPHPIPARKRSAWPAGIVLLSLAAAVVLGAWLYHSFRKKQSVILTVEPPPAVEVKPIELAGETFTSSSSADKPASVSAESTKAPTNNDENTDKTDPVEVIECARLSGPAEASATFVGTYENHSSRVLRWVRVMVTVAQPNGKKLRASSIEYKNIPPGWRGRFSVDAAFRFEPGMRIEKVEARSETAPELRGWTLNGWLKDVTDEETIRITGEANNTTNQPLTDPVVWCDFFTRRGLYVGSAKGKFRRNGHTLVPGTSRAYEIHFDPGQVGSSSRLLAEPQLRLLGRAEN